MLSLNSRATSLTIHSQTHLPLTFKTHQKANKKFPLSWESAIPNILTNSNTHIKIKCTKQIPQPNQTLKTYLIYIPLFVNPPKPSKKCWGFCLVQLKKKKTLLTLYQHVSFYYSLPLSSSSHRQLFSFLLLLEADDDDDEEDDSAPTLAEVITLSCGRILGGFRRPPSTTTSRINR